MLSTSNKNNPHAKEIAILPDDSILYYIPENYELTRDDKYKPFEKTTISDSEIQKVWRVLDGHSNVMGQAEAYKYYKECKQNLLYMKKEKFKWEGQGDIMIIPRNEENQREAINCTGPSGSGKSYWTGEYIKLYLEQHPQDKVFIVSLKDRDPAYDELIAEYPKRIARLDLEECFGEEAEPMKVGEGEGEVCHCLIIFDDIEDIFDPKTKKRVYAFKDLCLRLGRSLGVNVILCNHISFTGQDTRTSLNECNGMVFYKEASAHYTDAVLKKYLGVSGKVATELRKVPSRWMYISKNVPRIAVFQKEVWLIKD